MSKTGLAYAAFGYLPRESLAFGARQLAQTDIPVVSDFAAWDVQNTDLVWEAINRTDLQGNPLTTQEQLNVGFEGYTGFVGEALTIYTVYEGVGALWQLGKAAYEGVTSKPPPDIGPHREMRRPVSDDLDSHHIIQNAWAEQQNIAGYSMWDAPAVRLGPEHEAANAVQRAFRAEYGWNTTLEQELQMARDALQAAGLSSAGIDTAIEAARQYFAGLGMQ